MLIKTEKVKIIKSHEATKEDRESNKYSKEIQKEAVLEIFMRGRSYGKTRAENIKLNPENNPKKEPKIEVPDDFIIPGAKEMITSAINKLPQTITTNIRSITCTNEKRELPDDLGIKGFELAHADFNGNIFITGGISQEKNLVLDKIIFHECGHFCFEYNALLSDEEKFSLINKIKNRVISSDNFWSNYVSQIKNKDKKTELLRKTVEYFSEIISAYYMNNPSLPEEDVAILKEFRIITEETENYKKAIIKLASIETYVRIYYQKFNPQNRDSITKILKARRLEVDNIKEEATSLFNKKEEDYAGDLNKLEMEIIKTINDVNVEIEKEIEKDKNQHKKVK
ncbi:MAG: hypothetical protein WCO84_03240 [bacterium]